MIRRLRRLPLLLTLSAIALVATAAPALASTITPSFTTSLPAGTITPGSSHDLTVRLAVAGGTTASDNEFTIDAGADQLGGTVGTPSVTGAGITCGTPDDLTGTIACTLASGSVNGNHSLVLPAVAPNVYDDSWSVSVSESEDSPGAGTFSPASVSTAAHEVASGGPSDLGLSLVGDVPTNIVLGASKHVHVALRNDGAGTAEGVVLTTYDMVGISMTLAGHSCSPSPIAGYPVHVCTIGVVGPGASIDLDFTLTGTAFTFGSLQSGFPLFVAVSGKQDAGSDGSDVIAQGSSGISVTDGTTVGLRIVQTAGADAAAAGASTTFGWALVNDGPAVMPASVVRLAGTCSCGLLTSGAATFTAASVTGGSCAVDPAAAPAAVAPDWLCSVPEIAVGSRLDLTATATTPTADRDYLVSGSVDHFTSTTAFPLLTGGSYFYGPTSTRTTAADLTIVATSPTTTTIGTDQTATVTVRNEGGSIAADAIVTASLSPGTGFVGASGATCILAVNSTLTCFLGDVAPGAVATFQVRLRPTALGSTGTTFIAQSNGQERTFANNTASAFTNVVPVVLPVTPVHVLLPTQVVATLVKAAGQKVAAALKSGVPTTLTLDRDGVVRVQLYASPAIANSVHFKVRKPVLVASALTSVKAGRKSVVTARFTTAAKAKLKGYRKNLPLTETITVSSATGAARVITRTVTLAK